MKTNFAPVSKSGKRRDIVDDAVRKVWGRSHEEDSVAVDEAGDTLNVNLI
jgi:hypothetical protein